MDAENQAVINGTLNALPEEILKTQLMAKLQIFQQRCPKTKIALVPSLQELAHDYAFPQCAYQPAEIGDIYSTLFLAPNPGIIWVDDFSIALSNIDVLLRLGLSEIQKSPQVPDRFTRLSSHLVAQSSFYPLSPPHEGANIDYNLLQDTELPFRPNLLITPSALRHFVRVPPGEDDSLIVLNPGQFCRKQALGSAAIITVNPASAAPSSFAARSRIDIIQF